MQPETGPSGASRRWLAVAAALAAVALSAAGLAWWVRGAGGLETTGTVARAPVGENASGAVLGDSGGPEVGVATGADAAAAAPGAGARNGSDSSPAANETGAADDPTRDDPTPEDGPDVEPEAVEEALDLDRAGWQRIQEGLAALGLDPGAPDGLVGGGTRRAVRAYQEGAGKPATGFLDAADAAALRDAAAGADRVAQQRAAEAERQRSAAAAAAAAEAERLAELYPPGRVFRDDCDGCPEMVVIPAGEFQMGSPAAEEGRNDDEGPLHRVRVGRFALGRYEVTREEYAAFATVTGRDVRGGCQTLSIEDNESGGGRSVGFSLDSGASWREPGFPQGASHPVTCVSWQDAKAYVEWLSGETGESYRLPSEAEWEYAARAGTATARYWGNGSGARCDYANSEDAALKRYLGERFGGNWNVDDDCTDGAAGTASVGSYDANDFRLFDMLGNVWEWTEDCQHDDNYAGAPVDGTAWTSGGDCGRRVLRGGSWYLNPRLLRSAARSWDTTGLRDGNAGFRVARTLD